MRRSALFAVQQALGATFTEMASWELPQHFGDPETEYQAVRQAVGLSDLSHRGLVRVTGKDRQRFLHAMVSNDTASLQPGQGCYATFLTHKGKLVADFVVYADAEAYLLDLEPQAVQPLIEALEGFVFSEDVVLQDESAESGLLSLQGPRAAELLALASEQAVPELPTYAHTRWQLAGQPLRLMRRSHTGELGYQLLAPLAALPDLWQALWPHHEACEARAVGLQALAVLRIEAGLPLLGRDMTDETMPLEANLDEAISYTKGCYIGQEVMARLEARGHVNRKLVGLLLGEARLPEPGSRVVSPQRQACSNPRRNLGWITSATYSPVRQQNIALGYVRHEVWTPGTRLAVQANSPLERGAPEGGGGCGTTIGATVAELPFYRA